MSIISGIDWFFFDVQSILHFIEPEQPIDEYTVIIEIEEWIFYTFDQANWDAVSGILVIVYPSNVFVLGYRSPMLQ